MSKTALLVSTACLTLSAAAQSTINATDRYAYGANAGWIDFRPSAADGVRVRETFLSGYAYAANFGWIDFGDGTPASPNGYSNASGDCGVNMSGNGILTGYAYAANIGWITFEQTQGKPKLDLLTGKFSGYVWSANIGWIALDTGVTDLKTDNISRPDGDGDGMTDTWEVLHFGNRANSSAFTDHDKDGYSDLAEYEADTNPNDPASRFTVVSHEHSDGAFFSSSTVTFTSKPSRLYRLEYGTTLTPPWSNSALGTFSPDEGSVTTRTFIRGYTSSLFVRAVAVKPLP